jgi:glutathione S-transferase
LTPPHPPRRRHREALLPPRIDDQPAGTLADGKEKALGWLKVLDQSLIGPRNGYLCGDTITIADYLGAHKVIAGNAIGCDLAS